MEASARIAAMQPQAPTHTPRQRLRIIGPGLALAALLALCLAALLLPPSSSPQGLEVMVIWVVIMGGPVFDTLKGLTNAPLLTALGWLGLLLIAAHPSRPHWATGLLTVIGLLLWFFAGLLSALVGLYGA